METKERIFIPNQPWTKYIFQSTFSQYLGLGQFMFSLVSSQRNGSYHFLTLKTFHSVNLFQHQKVSKEKKLSQQSEVRPALAHEVVSGSGAGHCKNSATNLQPSCACCHAQWCLLPCTVMPCLIGENQPRLQVARGSDTGWWFSIIFCLHDGGSRPRDHRDLISRHQH